MAFDTGPIDTQNQFPCRTLVACLSWTSQNTQRAVILSAPVLGNEKAVGRARPSVAYSEARHHDGVDAPPGDPWSLERVPKIGLGVPRCLDKSISALQLCTLKPELGV